MTTVALSLVALSSYCHVATSADESDFRPFRIRVEDSTLGDLHERLARTRWPDELDDAGWDYGVQLGYGLNDSPAGLAAWVIDKFWACSDHGGNLENSYSKDELLTNVMIYWVTDTMPSSVRIYFESSHNQARPPSMTPFTGGGKPAPIGFALFPKEINVPPRAWVERSVGNALVHRTEMPRGGHFAAMEQPALLAEDVRAFFHKVRARSRSAK